MCGRSLLIPYTAVPAANRCRKSRKVSRWHSGIITPTSCLFVICFRKIVSGSLFGTFRGMKDKKNPQPFMNAIQNLLKCHNRNPNHAGKHSTLCEVFKMDTSHLLCLQLEPLGVLIKREKSCSLTTFWAITGVLSLRSTVESANSFNLRRDFQLNKQTSPGCLLLTEMLELKRYVPHECCSVDGFIEHSNARD